MNDIARFYSGWYEKSQQQILFDIEVGKEKSRNAFEVLENAHVDPIKSILEIGCGYGQNLAEMMCSTKAAYGLGVDISQSAVDFANSHYRQNSTKFIHIDTVDINETVNRIHSIHPEPFDLLLLFDLLEHIPRPKTFIRNIASLGKYFLIKLPIENCILSNYLLPERMKSFPGAKHPDGHLREFTVNDVHHFVASLGFIPLASSLYLYSTNTTYPSHLRPMGKKGALYYDILRTATEMCKRILPRRLFLRLIGGGGFICLASWSEDYLLD